MIINYKYGFKFEGVLYGWKDKKLYRLPQTISKRFYCLKELVKRADGRYSVSRKPKSKNQLKDMTVFINYEYQDITDKDCPF